MHLISELLKLAFTSFPLLQQFISDSSGSPSQAMEAIMPSIPTGPIIGLAGVLEIAGNSLSLSPISLS